MEVEAQVVDPPCPQGGLSEASSDIQNVPTCITAAIQIEENERPVNDACQKILGEIEGKHISVIAQSCDAAFPQASRDQLESGNFQQNEGTICVDQSGSETTDGNSAVGPNSLVISETLIDASLTSEPLPSQPEQDVQKDTSSTVKCAGCGKVFGQPCALPKRANRVMLSLCDNCENITSAMFICISCGQECNSLAALRAHKQTHVVPEQRIFVCEMCGVGFQRQNTLEEHKCAVLSSQPLNKSDGKASLQELEVPLSKGRSRRKPKVTKKVRVEAIVKTLSKRNQQTEKKVDVVSNDIAQKKTQPVKRVQSKRKQQARGRKKAVRKTPLPVPPTKATPTLKKKILVDFQPPSTRRPRTERKVLTIPKVFECEECSEFFTERKELRKHKAMHKKETFHCETCKKEFKSKPSLKRHELTHSVRPTTVCDVCNKTFQSIHTLLTHKKTVHVDEKPYVCDICHKDFKQLGNMKTHRRTHTGEKPFVCSECGRAFAQMGNLQAHMVIHAASKPHVCEICGKSFSYLRSLQNHMRGTHTGERPFACEICEKTFSNQSVLRDHRRTHSDKRGYLCDKCGKGFKSYKNLKQHEKFHLDVRPYSCQVCGKGFVWFKSFQLHKRTHTGEKPYSCDQCDKVFSNIGSLKCHKRKHIYDYVAPPRKGRSTSKTHPSNIKASPPPSPPSAPSQMMIIPHPSLHPIPSNTRDHMVNSIHHHGDGSSSSPSTTTPIHHAIPTHSQAYSHAVYPQALCSFVTNSTGDFTIL